MTDSGFGLPQEDFAYIIVILAAVVHLILIITIIICSCCKHKCTCLDVTYERSSQRNNDTLSQQIGRLPDYNESEAQTNTANQSLVSIESRTVTSWRTSLLTRVQSRIGLIRPREPPREDPPAYGSHDFTEGHTNPVCSEEDLPPYQEHVRHLPPWYVAMETGSEDKPPLYEEVVNQKNT